MAKILNAAQINGNISKMVELPDNFIINGSVYDKYTLSPNPYEFVPIYSDPLNNMFLYQCSYINANSGSRTVLNGMIQDSVDPNISYVVTSTICGGTSAAGMGIRRITKTSTGLVDTLLYPANTAYNETLDIISQDQNRIYFHINRHQSSYYSYIGYVNKIDGKSATQALNSGISKVLKETDLFIYFAATTASAGTHAVYKYNKLSNVITTIFTDTTSNYWIDCVASDMDSDGTFYMMRDSKETIGGTDHCMAMKKYVLDISKDTVTASVVSLDTTAYSTGGKIPFYSNSIFTGCCWLLRYYDSTTGKKYMTQVIYNKGKTIELNMGDSAMYTYEMVDANNWKLVSYTAFAPIIYKAFLPVFNNQILLLAHEGGTHIYTWDTPSASYKRTAAYDGATNVIGMDTNNNIYVQYGDTSIEMISNVMPTTVFADFELETYNHQGLDINTNVVAYVKNYLGQNLATSLELTLYGSVKFTDTGLKTKTITTSNLNSVNIPVTIYDTGLLRVTTKIV